MFKLKIYRINGLDSIQYKKYVDSLILASKIINFDYRFKQGIINSCLFSNTNGLSNGEIYHKVIDYTWKISTCSYESNDDTVGYTKDCTTYINKMFLNREDVGFLAGHVAHELMHVMGFFHSWKNDESDAKTVPYRIGSIVRNLSDFVTDEKVPLYKHKFLMFYEGELV